MKNKIKKKEIMTKLCSVSGVRVGETITITATPVQGTAPFTISIYRDGLQIHTESNVALNQAVSYTYTTEAPDIGSIQISATMVDSCATGAKSATEFCDVAVVDASLSDVGFGDAAGNYFNSDCVLDSSYIGDPLSVVLSVTIEGARSTIIYNTSWKKDGTSYSMNGVTFTGDPGTYSIFTPTGRPILAGEYTELTATITSVTPA